MLKSPESHSSYNVTGNGERECRKLIGLDNQQPSTYSGEGSTTIEP
ncbi:hypothetical protein [Pseudalkalibacillus salsuginis]|nr:hypothetical protein [Pseudalkalibacillus salsuginis]